MPPIVSITPAAPIIVGGEHRRVERVSGHPEQFLRAVRDVNERGDKAEHAEKIRAVTRFFIGAPL